MTVTVISTLLVVGLIAIVMVGARTPSGVELTVEDGCLRMRITGKDAFYALCRGMSLPLASIKGVAVAPRHLVPQTGLRLLGTGIPRVLRAGSYGTGSARDFWLVRQAEEFLVIELELGEPYRRLVLEVPNPHAEALRLRPMVGAYTGVFSR